MTGPAQPLSGGRYLSQERMDVMLTSWLDYAVLRYGTPRIAPKGWTSLHFFRRQAWVWFPQNKNHNVCFDDFGGHVETRIGRPEMHIVSNSLTMPSDDEVMALLDIVWGQPVEPLHCLDCHRGVCFVDPDGCKQC